MPKKTIRPLHEIALALGEIPGPDGSVCAVCGLSEFRGIGRLKPTLGPGFTDHLSLAEPRVDNVCQGCKAVLSGRPGRNPPPLRMKSFVVYPETSEIKFIHRLEWWPILREYPKRMMILSWAESLKRHHCLHAGVSGKGFWHIGSDHGQIRWWHSQSLVDAIETLRNLRVGKRAIATGTYPPRVMAAHSKTVLECENAIRWYRGDRRMNLLLYAAPEPMKQEDNGEDDRMSIDQTDEIAVDLLAKIAYGSGYRVEQGIRFWGGFFLSRINRFSRLPLVDMTSRLIAECQVSASSAALAAGYVEKMDTATEEAVSKAIRRHAPFLHALAFERVRSSK